MKVTEKRNEIELITLWDYEDKPDPEFKRLMFLLLHDDDGAKNGNADGTKRRNSDLH